MAAWNEKSGPIVSTQHIFVFIVRVGSLLWNQIFALLLGKFFFRVKFIVYFIFVTSPWIATRYDIRREYFSTSNYRFLAVLNDDELIDW
jgi:hypothetical protein